MGMKLIKTFSSYPDRIQKEMNPTEKEGRLNVVARVGKE
jgi:3-deoxy-D-arabino-heptulosonate 7-phosphate (DAHP) synthase class II